MTVDWTKYPPLPPAPELPAWRDTPEREAYFRELDARLEFRKSGCFCCITGVPLIGIGQALVSWSPYQSLGNLATMIGGMILLLFLLWTLAYWLFWRFRLAIKYHEFPMALNRPDVSGEVTAILAARPDFDKGEFRKYWPSERHADMALEIIGWIRENWALPNKMFYPNDSLMLLYEHKLIGDEEDYGDHFKGISDMEQISGNYDNTFAEMVVCVAGAPGKDSAE